MNNIFIPRLKVRVFSLPAVDVNATPLNVPGIDQPFR